MSTTIAIPDELVEQVKSVARTESLENFFIYAVRKQVREIRAQPLRQKYERTHRRRTPRQVYEKTLAEAIAFERQYGIGSDQFLRDFEAGVLNEDVDDWVAYYHWRTLAYGLQRMEKEYGFKREAQPSGNG